jgi:TM2 domain-containing membrane protein YozV
LEKFREHLLTLNETEFFKVQSANLKDPTTLLYASIFLGPWGVDRFMLGDIGMGVLKILTGGVCGVLWLIDAINITKKTRQYNLDSIMLLIAGPGKPAHSLADPKRDVPVKFCIECGKHLHGDELCACEEAQVTEAKVIVEAEPKTADSSADISREPAGAAPKAVFDTKPAEPKTSPVLPKADERIAPSAESSGSVLKSTMRDVEETAAETDAKPAEESGALKSTMRPVRNSDAKEETEKKEGAQFLKQADDLD